MAGGVSYPNLCVVDDDKAFGNYVIGRCIEQSFKGFLNFLHSGWPDPQANHSRVGSRGVHSGIRKIFVEGDYGSL